MPEYLAPGVYVEEVSFRSKSIEGVPTSTTGFVGPTRFGPVRHAGGPRRNGPRLVTSFTEFEQVYGGLESLDLEGAAAAERIGYLAHAARMFFLNGGKRLYVSRVFAARAATTGVARTDPVALGGALPTARWRARWPGAHGNVALSATPMRGRVAPYTDPVSGTVQVRGVGHGAVLEVLAAGASADVDRVPDLADLRVVQVQPDGVQQFFGEGGAVAVAADAVVNSLEIKVNVVAPSGDRSDFYASLAGHPDQTRYIGRILDLDDPEDENALVALAWAAPPNEGNEFAAAALTRALLDATPVQVNADGTRIPTFLHLEGGDDGVLPGATDLLGAEADPDDATRTATGIRALGEVEEIAIVAAPSAGAYEDDAVRRTATDYLITHAESQKYRIAVVDGPRNASINQIRAFRGQFDSKYAALYHPWIEVLDPLQRAARGAPPQRLLLPPSGFVTGIYARTDIERGVHKAPANEIVRGLTRFEININRARQEVLNPEGINALRFLEGRGNRVWGARTMSSDPEWKYVNVRRLFIFIEHSIDKSSQWAVFEPNNAQLWDNVRTTVEDFLLVLWMQGALLGGKPEEAYFVRCDRTTMTQNDLDNGRLVCLVGIAPVKPAEFVIFRVGQWTADAKGS
jgi:uncharacterized protein